MITGLALASLASLQSARAIAADLYVICNTDVAIQATEIKDVFRGEKTYSGKVKLAPADNSAAQADFLQKIMALDAAKYTGIWIKKSFRDGASPPPLKASNAEALAYVRNTSGACSYVSTASPEGVSIVGKF